MASTASSREGDPVVAVLTQDIPLNGFTLRKGDEVRGRVSTVLKAARVKGRARLVVASTIGNTRAKARSDARASQRRAFRLRPIHPLVLPRKAIEAVIERFFALC